METGDDAGLTVAILASALAVVALSVLMQRRQRLRPRGWVPWNGLLFIAIVAAAVAVAHLLGVKQR